jgi:hypothetical protein
MYFYFYFFFLLKKREIPTTNVPKKFPHVLEYEIIIQFVDNQSHSGTEICECATSTMRGSPPICLLRLNEQKI